MFKQGSYKKTLNIRRKLSQHTDAQDTLQFYDIAIAGTMYTGTKQHQAYHSSEKGE
jgi:hypothetical protein